MISHLSSDNSMYQQNTNLKGCKKNGTKLQIDIKTFVNTCKSSFYINVID